MNIKNSLISAFVFGISTILLVFVIAGCSSSTRESESSGNLQITTITASPSSIAVGASTVIEAQVTDGTNPLSNRVVTFSVPSDYGYCVPTVDTSDEDGMVATVYTAAQSGSAVITATVSETVSNSVSVTVTYAQTGSGNISVVVSPTMVLADGSDTSIVTVTVRDSDGQPAPESTLVKLVAGEKFEDVDENGYFTPGLDYLLYDANSNYEWDAIGAIPSTAYTSDDSGQAVVNYIAGTLAGTVYIRATVTESGYNGYAETTLQLRSDATIASIVMTSDSIHLAVKSTGGMETSMLRAIGYDCNGNSVPEGLQISFIITDGPDTSAEGEHLGALTGSEKRGPYVATTNGKGIASCPISSGTRSGTIRVRAYTDSVLSNATQIMVHAGPPYRIVVCPEECNVEYWGWCNRTVGVTAVVSDIFNNPCPDSTVVYFTCDEGVIKAHEARIQGENGLAHTVWMSWGADTLADGDVVIYAETNGGTLIDSSVFINSWHPDTIWFTVFPSSMYANGKSKGFLYIQVRDLNMNFIADLSTIKFESEYVEFTDREDGDGCFSSGVSNYIKSVILDQDYSMNGMADDGIGAIDYVTARYAFLASATLPCTLLTGPAYYSGCILDAPSTVNYATSVPFTVIIKDRSGNPLGDHTIVAGVVGGGTISNGTQSTNTYGEATGFQFNAPALDTSITSVTITAQDIDPRGNVTLSKTVSLTE